jgi:hypothetical protein
VNPVAEVNSGFVASCFDDVVAIVGPDSAKDWTCFQRTLLIVTVIVGFERIGRLFRIAGTLVLRDDTKSKATCHRAGQAIAPRRSPLHGSVCAAPGRHLFMRGRLVTKLRLTAPKFCLDHIDFEFGKRCKYLINKTRI